MSVASAERIDLGSDPIGHRRPRIPNREPARTHQKWPLCEVSGKRRLTQRAAELHIVAVTKLGRNINTAHMRNLRIKRAYLCPDCNDYHLTSQAKVK
jgi:hypothetical protein